MNNLDKKSLRRTFQNVNIFLTLSLLELKGLNHPHFCWSPQYTVFLSSASEIAMAVFTEEGEGYTWETWRLLHCTASAANIYITKSPSICQSFQKLQSTFCYVNRSVINIRREETFWNISFAEDLFTILIKHSEVFTNANPEIILKNTFNHRNDDDDDNKYY